MATELDFPAISAVIGTEIRADAEKAGISWAGNNVNVRRTAKNRRLIGEAVAYRMNGMISLDRWAAHGVTVEILRANSDTLALHMDRQRKLESANVRRKSVLA